MYKRPFDIFVSLAVLLLLAPVLIVAWLGAAIDTKSSGMFVQARIGRFAKPFPILKLRTMRRGFPKRISRFGMFLRNSKIDELPQFVNVVAGHMSIVGPRPDISGYYDRLEGETGKLLELRPGITSLASIKYRSEEAILAGQKEPLIYNDEVIFPDKVKMNLEYYYNQSLIEDIKIILATVAGYFKKI